MWRITFRALPFWRRSDIYGDEQIIVGFAPPPGAINVAATPICMPDYFVKVHYGASPAPPRRDESRSLDKSGTYAPTKMCRGERPQAGSPDPTFDQGGGKPRPYI